MSRDDQKYIQTVLENWEEVYKRGQLTLWVLLALFEGPKSMEGVREWLILATNGTITAEERSLYRVLQRFYDAELVEFSMKASDKGPDQKIYSLSSIGKKVLARFINRNIELFLQPNIQKLLRKAS